MLLLYMGMGIYSFLPAQLRQRTLLLNNMNYSNLRFTSNISDDLLSNNIIPNRELSQQYYIRSVSIRVNNSLTANTSTNNRNIENSVANTEVLQTNISNNLSNTFTEQIISVNTSENTIVNNEDMARELQTAPTNAMVIQESTNNMNFINDTQDIPQSNKLFTDLPVIRLNIKKTDLNISVKHKKHYKPNLLKNRKHHGYRQHNYINYKQLTKLFKRKIKKPFTQKRNKKTFRYNCYVF
jgi:hypothetical protein